MTLGRDKKDSVRGASAVALGQIGDESAVVPLTQLLGRRVPASGLINRVRRSKKDENEFVRRAAAHSLGQIRSRAAVPALTAVLLDERAPDDVRRESATSLSLIGDPSSVAAFRAVLTSRDPHLALIAYDSLIKIAPKEAILPASEPKLR
jgi:HEAT repeat protein